MQGFENIVATDVGGTSFDLGLVVKGSPNFYQFRPVIDRWGVEVTMLESRSIGAGGGSIARVNPILGNQLEVGPQSAGSMPGPACYDLGGTEPTVTDADVVLGYLNPDYFHGGKIKLDREKAVNAIREKIARPLGVDIEQAARLIKKVVDGHMGGEIFKETVLRGYDPKEFVVFAFGGGGPTHCCGYSFGAGVPRVVTFPNSPVFCALGSAVMDMVQFYEMSRHLPLIKPGSLAYTTDYESFNEVVLELQKRAVRDLAGQGIPAEKAIFTLELEMRYGGQLNMKRVSSPRLFMKSLDDAQAIYRQFEKEYSEAYSPLAVYPQGGVDISSFILKSCYLTPKFEMPKLPLKGAKPPAAAYKGQREAYWEETGRYQPTSLYEQDLLEPGNVLEGPVIIESPDTNTVIPPGRTYRVNEYRSGIIE
jgi:N-methylhydantoinase A/acetophenone carboxylase